MLSVNINRDVEQYQEAVMAGFNAKQTVAVIIAVLVGTGAVCLCYFAFGVPLEISVYLAIPICAPIVLTVFGRDGDISFGEKLRGNLRRAQMIPYYSTETQMCKKQISKNNQVKKIKTEENGGIDERTGRNKKRIQKRRKKENIKDQTGGQV